MPINILPPDNIVLKPTDIAVCFVELKDGFIRPYEAEPLSRLLGEQYPDEFLLMLERLEKFAPKQKVKMTSSHMGWSSIIPVLDKKSPVKSVCFVSAGMDMRSDYTKNSWCIWGLNDLRNSVPKNVKWYAEHGLTRKPLGISIAVGSEVTNDENINVKLLKYIRKDFLSDFVGNMHEEMRKAYVDTNCWNNSSVNMMIYGSELKEIMKLNGLTVEEKKELYIRILMKRDDLSSKAALGYANTTNEAGIERQLRDLAISEPELILTALKRP